MSDDERIARCTELAQRVWPGSSISHELDGTSVITAMQRDGERIWTEEPVFICHPRALDALEAALLALAAGGKITPQVQAAYDALLGKPDARVAELEAKLAGVLALADEWESLAARINRPTIVDPLNVAIATMLDAARELRERAKAT